MEFYICFVCSVELIYVHTLSRFIYVCIFVNQKK